jgi:hypothetical protein
VSVRMPMLKMKKGCTREALRLFIGPPWSSERNVLQSTITNVTAKVRTIPAAEPRRNHAPFVPVSLTSHRRES